MKTKSKCIGCQAIKLVNPLGLCKRCNREAHKFLSDADMQRIKREREDLLAAAIAAKKAKKEAAAEAHLEGEVPKEGEEEEKGEDADSDDTEDK